MDHSKLTTIYADLHIHIGRSIDDLPVKITASRNMTFSAILHEAYHRKGVQMIGIVDAHSPPVQKEICKGLESGLFHEHPDGGIQYQGVTCLLGTEIEIKESGMKPAHLLIYLPTIQTMKHFTAWLSLYMKNVQLSTQRFHYPVSELMKKVMAQGGVIIPAHIFSPFKSVYGSATDSIYKLFSKNQIEAVELGLSADQKMADSLSELGSYTFLTNSDAHSLAKIGREYNLFLMKEASFQEFRKVLYRLDGRQVIANYGLNPKLGKYYRTRCLSCDQLWQMKEQEKCCPKCRSTKKVTGVYERIQQLSDQPSHTPTHRPPYIYQVPLEFIPKLGKKTLNKLLDYFGTEMNILHSASIEQISEIVHPQIAQYISQAREQKLALIAGGGGKYGKVMRV